MKTDTIIIGTIEELTDYFRNEVGVTEWTEGVNIGEYNEDMCGSPIEHQLSAMLERGSSTGIVLYKKWLERQTVSIKQQWVNITHPPVPK